MREDEGCAEAVPRKVMLIFCKAMDDIVFVLVGGMDGNLRRKELVLMRLEELALEK